MENNNRESLFANAARETFGSIGRFAKDLYSAISENSRTSKDIDKSNSSDDVFEEKIKSQENKLNDLLERSQYLNSLISKQFKELISNLKSFLNSVTGGLGLGVLGGILGTATAADFFGDSQVEEIDLYDEEYTPNNNNVDFTPSDRRGDEGVGRDVAERTAETLEQPLIADIGEISEESGLSPAFRGMGLPGYDQGVQPTSIVGYARGRGRPHHGADYYVPPGEGLRAQANGVVRHIGSYNEYGTGNYGRTVVVEYENGMVIQYSHLAPESTEGLVEVGQQVERGQLMAITGASGTMYGTGQRGQGVTDPHIHLEMTSSEAYNRLFPDTQGGLVKSVGMPNLYQPNERMGFDRFEGDPQEVEVRPIIREKEDPETPLSVPEAPEPVTPETPPLSVPEAPEPVTPETPVVEPENDSNRSISLANVGDFFDENGNLIVPHSNTLRDFSLADLTNMGESERVTSDTNEDKSATSVKPQDTPLEKDISGDEKVDQTRNRLLRGGGVDDHLKPGADGNKTLDKPTTSDQAPVPETTPSVPGASDTNIEVTKSILVSNPTKIDVADTVTLSSQKTQQTPITDQDQETPENPQYEQTARSEPPKTSESIQNFLKRLDYKEEKEQELVYA